MRKFPIVFIAALANLAVAGFAEAKAVTAKDPSSIVSVLQKNGYRAELSEDDSGDPMISSASSGTDFVIHFYGCTDNRSCSRVQFMISVETPRDGAIEKLNEWNSRNYFGRAYLTEEGAARLEMDLDLDEGGMSAALFNDNMQWWNSILDDFGKRFAGG